MTKIKANFKSKTETRRKIFRVAQQEKSFAVFFLLSLRIFTKNSSQFDAVCSSFSSFLGPLNRVIKMSSVSESPKKHVLYPSNNQPSASSKSSPPKASHHHMPKVTLPKVHASQIQTSNQHQYYSLRWNNYQK